MSVELAKLYLETDAEVRRYEDRHADVFTPEDQLSIATFVISQADRIEKLEAALGEALDWWAGHYEDRRCSGDPLLDPREQELRRLL